MTLSNGRNQRKHVVEIIFKYLFSPQSHLDQKGSRAGGILHFKL